MSPRRPFALLLAVAGVALAHAQETWRLDNVAKLGVHAPTVLGSPRVTTDIGGRKESAVVFDGLQDGVFVPANPIAGAAAFTIEVLFWPAEGGPRAQRFVHVQDQAEHRALIETRLDGQGGWYLDTFLWTGREADKGLALADAKRVHPTNRWYWAALRFDGKTMTHFVNGQQELTGEVLFPPLGAGQVSLGVRQNKVYWFKGAIAEVRFHREALPAEKLQRLE